MVQKAGYDGSLFFVIVVIIESLRYCFGTGSGIGCYCISIVTAAGIGTGGTLGVRDGGFSFLCCNAQVTAPVRCDLKNIYTGLPVIDARIVEPTLEDIFVEKAGGKEARGA